MSATLRFEAIGAPWELETDAPISEELRRRLIARALELDATYSRFRTDSVVSRIAASPHGGRFELPLDSVALFELYDRLHRLTDGAVDPLVGRALELLGYDRTYSLVPSRESLRAEMLPGTRPTWADDVVREGTSLTTRRPVVIDIGAAGKGFLVDELAALLRGAGHANLVVDGSGDLRHEGEGHLRVGLEHPFDPALLVGVASLSNRSLCASAVNRRAWGDGLHHVVDARTGVPARDVLATWVIADDTATADGIATALFFARPERILEELRFSYVRMFADGSAEWSPDFEGEIFS